jgi:hypothetical protein
MKARDRSAQHALAAQYLGKVTIRMRVNSVALAVREMRLSLRRARQAQSQSCSDRVCAAPDRPSLAPPGNLLRNIGYAVAIGANETKPMARNGASRLPFAGRP